MPRHEDIRVRSREELTALVAKLNKRQSAELQAAFGSPARFENVPHTLWAKFEKEFRTDTQAAFLLLFASTLDSQEDAVTKRYGGKLADDPKTPGFDGRLSVDEKQRMAEELAQKAAEDLARDYVKHTRDRIEEATKAEKEVEKALEKILNGKRAEGVGQTETNKGIVSAEDAYNGKVEDYSNFLLVAQWKHQGYRPAGHCNSDTDPCPVCSPLEGLWQWEWPMEHAAGPPAHPWCDCFAEYELMSRDDFEANYR